MIGSIPSGPPRSPAGRSIPPPKYRYGSDAAFPSSDHADFNDLLACVERVQPDVVYTLHGFAREFAATLRDRGVEAWAIGQGNQMELSL